MVLPILLIATAGMTALSLAKSQRLAPWFLFVGVLLFGGLWLLGKLRIPWPDLGMWTVFVLNPYLLVTLSFTLIVAGAIGVTVKALHRWLGWFGG